MENPGRSLAGLAAACALLASCALLDLHDGAPESTILYESRLASSGAAEPALELLRIEGTSKLRGVAFEAPRAAAALGAGIVFDLSYSLCPVAQAGSRADYAETQAFRYLFASDGSGKALGLEIGPSDILALDAASTERGILVSGSSWELSLCSFDGRPSLGAAKTDYRRISGEERDPRGIWAVPGSGYLALAYDWALRGTVATYLDDSLRPLSAMVVDYERLDPPIAGIARDGRALILERLGPSAYSVYRLSRDATGETPRFELNLPPSLAGASLAWAGDRFWFRSVDAIASLGFDFELSGVERIAEAEASAALSDIVGLDDGGFALVGPVNPCRFPAYRGPIPVALSVYALRYDAELRLSYRARIDYGSEPGRNIGYSQALVLGAAEASGEPALLVSLSTWGAMEILDGRGR
jgi:hypothetical protein